MSTRPLIVVLTTCLMAVPAGAQSPAPPGGTVTGLGFVDLKRQPEVLRVQVEILAKGKDLKEALARLKERREAARSRVAALGAIKDAVVFGEPALSSEKTDQQKQLEAMVARGVRFGGAKPAAKIKETPPAVVSFWLRFEVPLKATDAEDLLLVSQRLQEQVRAADLAGLKEFKKLSPQEEELAEEAQLTQGQEGEPKRGEPTFAFVAKLSEADLAKATAEAFQKARHEAAKLAQAAGAELGRLHHLESQNGGLSAEETAYMSYSGRMAYQARMAQNFPAPERPEAVGNQPGQVTYRVAVTAAFLLKGRPD
jgi:uncharacterized protein YggE